MTDDMLADAVAEHYEDRCELCARQWTHTIRDPRTHVVRFMCGSHFDQIAGQYRADRIAREITDLAVRGMIIQAAGSVR